MNERKRWFIFTTAISGLFSLTITAIILSMQSYLIIGGLIGSVSVLVWWYGVFEGDSRKLQIGILLASFLFAFSIVDRIITNTLISAFPIQLLAFNLFLFNVEMMSLVPAHHKLHREVTRSIDLAQRSWKIMQRKLSVLIILFSGCYVITISAIYLGGFIYTLFPIFGDTSIYLTVVFVSLALFVTLREESTTDRYKKYR